MRTRILLFLITIVAFSSCRENRIHEHDDWARFYEAHGIKKACIIIRDNNHEAIDYYNKERCLERFMPASTFKIMGSLIGLETATAPDEQYIIKWDGVPMGRDTCNKDMTMREAFRVSCYNYFREIANQVGQEEFQAYIDTVKYGNQRLGTKFNEAWVNDTLKISADEQVGFVKRLYFNELPFSERSQRIVRSMMVWEDTPEYKLSYKTGTGQVGDNYIYWIVGYIERVQQVKENEKSMNKSNFRQYPYFFAQNFEAPVNDTTKDYFNIRVEVLKQILKEYGAMPK